MSSVKNITSSSRRHADKPKARGCGHWINGWDVHHYCPSCRENNSAKGKLPADPCMNGDPCQICKTFSADQLDKIASRRKCVRKPKDPHRPDLSADLETGSYTDMPISAAQEASLLEISHENVKNLTLEPHPEDQETFQGREPPVVQNVVLQPQAMSTPATVTAVPATPWRTGLQQEISNVSQRMDARYNAMENLVAQSQVQVQASMQASMEAMFKQYLGTMQAPIARPRPHWVLHPHSPHRLLVLSRPTCNPKVL